MKSVRAFPAVLCALASLLPHPAGAGPACIANSGAQRVALLELYTSEGCDSCPPTDRWLSGLPSRGIGTDQVVALGFHVDYWNYLGWRDPFAKPEYSARQRTASERNRSRFVYTPQLLLDGKDFRRGMLADNLEKELGALRSKAPGAELRLALAAQPDGVLDVDATANLTERDNRTDARLYIALYEDRLANEVNAGENRGKRLRHDFVVRQLAGPFAFESGGASSIKRPFRIASGWKQADLNVAAFVQNGKTGEVLQALALRNCAADDLR